MSIKKQYLKKDGVCKITFSLRDKDHIIKSVRIPGDFNKWDRNCEPMKKHKNNEYSQSITLQLGKSYQFRYLINDSLWEDEPESDRFVPSGVDNSDFNSVITV